MRQDRSERPWSAWVWLQVGALTLLLAVAAGTAGGREPPPREARPAAKETAPPVPLPVQVQPVKVIVPPQPQVNVETPPSANPTTVLIFSETLSGFMIFIFAAGGVTALAVTARFYFRLTQPKDPLKVALSDPWVRANLSRLPNGQSGNPPPEAAS
jgi:hypothetical protein